jgi:hypothetical protein
LDLLAVLSIPALVLLVIPFLLSWRWLAVFAALTAFGLTYLWQNHWAHQGEGNGFAEVMGGYTLYSMTAAAVAGVLARALMLTVRGFRYGWLAIPIILTVIATDVFLRG